MGACLDWNSSGSPDAHAAVAEALGASKDASATATAFRTLLDQTGIDRSLIDKKIDPVSLAEVMLSEENKPMMENNARPITPDDALELAKRTLSLS
jgi:alcohol dehydrogenase class IV